jgi:hypothetical protein
MQNFTIFNKKNGKLLTRKHYIFFNQDLTHNNTKKMSRKYSRMRRNFFRNFIKDFETCGDVVSSFYQEMLGKGGVKSETGKRNKNVGLGAG